MIPMQDRFWAKVDKGVECWEWTGCRTEKGYGSFRVNGKGMVKAHRVSYELAFGPIPEGIQIDHACHNKACVRPEHLRFATNKQNAENRAGAAGHTKSGIRGVYPYPYPRGRHRWYGRVQTSRPCSPPAI